MQEEHCRGCRGQDGLSVWEPYGFQDRVPFCVGDEASVQTADRGCRGTGRKLVRQTCAAFEIQIIKGVVSQGSCPHSGVGAAGDGTERDHAADRGPDGEQAVREISAAEAKVLGTAFVGVRLFLCGGWGNDRRNDRGVFETSF